MKLQKTLTVTVLLALAASMPLSAQKSRDEKLKRDIHIMEGVLDKVLSQQAEARFVMTSGAKGMYVPGYGLIFYAQSAGGRRTLERLAQWNTQVISTDRVAEGRKIDEKKLSEMKETQRKKEAEYMEALKVMEEDAQKRQQEELTALKNQVYHFYRNYATAISQLKTDERLAVMIKDAAWHSGKTSTKLTSWVNATDIKGYRDRKLTSSQFLKTIHMNDDGGTARDVEQDVGILLEILNRALEVDNNSSRHNVFFSSKSGDSVYLQGLGAIIFISMPREYMVTSHSTPSVVVAGENFYSLRGETIERDEKEIKRQKEEEEKRLSQLKRELVELIGDYGHTLRLPADESLLLSVESSSPFIVVGSKDTGNKNWLLRFKKADIEAYQAGSLSLKALEERASLE